MLNPFSKLWHFLNRVYHRLASPREFYQISRYTTPLFGTLSLLLCLPAAYLGLFEAPPDYQQGDSFRIIYVHVPSAILSQFVYVVMACAAAIGLIWRIKMAFAVAICSAPLGATFTALALITGSLWGAPTWGTWWEWDARLTSELILLFIYFGVMSLYYAFEDRKSAESAMALLAVVGVVIVPIIKYSVVWWSSLHQGSTLFSESGDAMPSSMKSPLIMMIFGFLFYYGYALFTKLQVHVLRSENKSNWVKKMVNQLDSSNNHMGER